MLVDYMQVLCHFNKRLEHSWIWVSEKCPGTEFPRMLRDNSTEFFSKYMFSEWVLHSVVFIISFLALVILFSGLRLTSSFPGSILWPTCLVRVLFSFTSVNCPSGLCFWRWFHSQTLLLPSLSLDTCHQSISWKHFPLHFRGNEPTNKNYYFSQIFISK